MKKYILLIAIIIFIIAAWYLIRTTGENEQKLSSHILGETRSLLVHLPKDYTTSNKRYPVLYLLDGGNRKIHSRDVPIYTSAVNTLNHLADNQIPGMILVGVANTNRARDMLPVKVNFYPDSGGADYFLRFLREELIPYIDRHYRTTPYRILHGMSDSGLFAVYTFLTAPDSFSAYIASSPTLGWCPEFIKQKTDALLEKKRNLEKHLYIIYDPKDYPYCAPGVPPFVEILKKSSPVGFHWKVNAAKGVGHAPPSSLRHGLEFIFSPPAQPHGEGN